MDRQNLWAVITALGCLVYPAGPTSAPPSPPPTSAGETIRPTALRAHMSFLADDLLEGRGTATRGYELAARYVAAQRRSRGPSRRPRRSQM